MLLRSLLALLWMTLALSAARHEVGQEAPLNPSTGKPYLCIPNPELFEAVCFKADYLAKHPGEKARLVRPDKNGMLLSSRHGVIFTRDGMLQAYNYRVPSMTLSGLTTSDFESEKADKAYQDELSRIAQKNINREMNPSEYADNLFELDGALEAPAPWTLEDDDKNKILARILARAAEIHVKVSKVPTGLVHEAGDFSYSYNLQSRQFRKTLQFSAKTKAYRSRLSNDSVKKELSGMDFGRIGLLDNSSPEFVSEVKRRAAESSLHDKITLGFLYMEGKGVPKDPEKAAGLFLELESRPSDKRDDKLWMVGLYKYYLHKKDDANAYKWALKSAYAGFTECQYNVGAMLASGRGTTASRSEALAWFLVCKRTRSAEQNKNAVINGVRNGSEELPGITAILGDFSENGKESLMEKAELRALEIMADIKP